jgi:hypothetical protein
MTTRRQELLDKLEAAAATAAPECLTADCRATCFQILYGLPLELQIRAASSMLQRYLSIFEKKQPSLTWARGMLEDPDGWAGKVWSGVTPDYPEGADSADTDYWSGFSSLLHARVEKDDPARLAANACCAIADVAEARARNVWLADDPEAARIEREEDAFWALHQEYRPDAPPPDPPALFKELESPAHGRYYNVAFIAVYRREWGVVAAWLRSEAVWQYPEPDDLDAMMQALARWQSEPLFPIAHTWEEDGYPPDYTPE